MNLCAAVYSDKIMCGKDAPYICIKCNKYFCIDDMYLMCDVCFEYIMCFRCGFNYKYIKGTWNLTKNYCLKCYVDV